MDCENEIAEAIKKTIANKYFIRVCFYFKIVNNQIPEIHFDFKWIFQKQIMVIEYFEE